MGLTSDIILIRMADVYLMHSELTQTVTYMNKVRQRAGLPPYASYSLESLKRNVATNSALKALQLERPAPLG